MNFKTALIISTLFISNLSLAQNGEELYQQALKTHHYSKNYPLAFNLAQQSCNLGNMNGCNLLGILYEYGEGVKQDYFQARKLYELACNNGSMKACANLGQLYYEGEGVSKDFYQAKKYLKRACDAFAPTCANLGDFYRDQKNYGEARKYYQIACDNKHSHSCNELGRIYHNNKDYLLAKRN